MNILQVANTFTRGGFETFVSTLSKALLKQGHQTFFAIDNYNPADGLSLGMNVDTDYHFCSGSRMTVGELLDDVDRLVATIENKHIEALLVHPFHCIYPAVIAAQLTRTPIAYVLHGNISAAFPSSLSETALMHLFVSHMVDVIFSVNKSSLGYFGQTGERQVVIPQPIYMQAVKRSCPPQNKDWALVSRLDYDKVEGIKHFLDMVPSLDMAHIYIFGTGNCERHLVEHVKKLGLDKQVTFHGFDTSWIEKASSETFGAIGLGRVVLESLANGIPTLMLSSAGYPCGMLDSRLMAKAAEANYNGSNLRQIVTPDTLNAQIRAAYAAPARFNLADIIHQQNSAESVAELIVRHFMHDITCSQFPYWDKVLQTARAEVADARVFSESKQARALLQYASSYYADPLLLTMTRICQETGAGLSSLQDLKEGTRQQIDELREYGAKIERRYIKANKKQQGSFDAMQRKLKHQQKQVSQLQNELKKLKSSRSWKIGRVLTAPARWLKHKSKS